MVTRIARIFTNGGSQAVRLPAEFRFANAHQVYVRRDAVTGDVVLSAQPGSDNWGAFFAVRDHAQASAPEVTDDRPMNTPLKRRELF
jgi:antitoxin VapB